MNWYEPYLTPTGYLVMAAFLAWVLLIVSGYIHKWIKDNDGFDKWPVIMFGVGSWDFFSDVLFASDVYGHYSSDDMTLPVFDEFDEVPARVRIFTVFLFSSIFIILPLIANVGGLLYYTRKWRTDARSKDRFNLWFNDNGKRAANTKLFLLSLVGGSIYSGVELVHSKLFYSDALAEAKEKEEKGTAGNKKMDEKRATAYTTTLFNMNLSEAGEGEREEVGIFRVGAVVILENVPQLIIQIYYASVIEHGIGTVTGTSMIFSAMSIIATVFGFCSTAGTGDSNPPPAKESNKNTPVGETTPPNTAGQPTEREMAEIKHASVPTASVINEKDNE